MLRASGTRGFKLQLIAAACGLAAIEAGAASAQPAPVARSTALVDEIVVTARKREERVQDVPASVTTVSAQKLDGAGVGTVQTLAQVTPGLLMVGSGTYVQPVIRGISSTSNVPGDEANVAIYVDGVYLSQMQGNFFDFNNIERVEVLKGPQGTLFGRNATGGAITIITKAPSFTPEGKISISRGKFETTDLSGYFSTGLTDTLALSLATVYHNDEGYVRDLIRGGHLGYKTFWSVRGKLLYKPSDSLSFTVIADTVTSNNITNTSSQPLNGNNTVGRLLRPNDPLPTKPWQTVSSVRPFNYNYQTGASVRADYAMGWANFMSITAWRHEKQDGFTDVDGSLVHVRTSHNLEPSETFTQEFQLNSPADKKVQWVGGLYYYNNIVGYDPVYNLTQVTGTTVSPVITALPPLFTRVRTEAYAAFGEATANLTEAFSVTAGLRYSYERKRNWGKPNPTAANVNVGANWNDLTPRVVAKYEFPEVLNVYASVSKGFKSGQFNSSTLSGSAVNPERVTAYEIGAKTLRAGSWRASAAVYRYNYTDIQVSSRLGGNNAIAQLNNAARARIQGAELQAEGRLTPEFSIGGGIAYMDATYRSFPGASVTFPSTAVNPTPASACTLGTGPLIGGNRQVICDVSGARLIRSPKWTGNVGAAYQTPLADGLLDASANAAFVSKFYWDALNRVAQPSYWLINAQLGWTAPDGRTRLSIWGNNLTNEAYLIVASTSGNADWGGYGAPRTYGVKLSYTY